ncbi:MAG: ABC transporter permease subunit [Firmicutes bacterium]|nr:ABC transporter permease subunit [Bacillota bacterium]
MAKTKNREALLRVLRHAVKCLYPIIALGLFFAVWATVSAIYGNKMILPAPREAFSQLFKLMAGGSFWLAVFGTLSRALVSFVISLTLAGILATLAYLFKPLSKVLSPLVLIARATPTMSFILLAVIWFSPNTAPMLIACLVTFPLLYASVFGAFNGIGSDIKNMAKIFNLPPLLKVKAVYIPLILPTVFTSAKSNISLTVKLMIAGEVIAQTANSMGNSMQLSRLYFNTAELMGWTIVAVGLSFLLELLVEGLRKMALKWERT